ncbi:MAG: helix-turn-helix domain-containing protein [Candidatus Eremiobacterota bacterium]
MHKNFINEYNPDFVSPPGDTLAELLKERGMTQAELAQRTGKKTKTINQIIKGIAPITPRTSIQLERVLWVPAGFWDERERKYQEFLARNEEKEELKKQLLWLNNIPVKEMIKLNWIEKYSDKVLQLQEILSFLGIASPDQYEAVLSCAYYRKSQVFKSDPGTLSVWLRKGEIEARNIQTESYSLSSFRTNLKKIRNLTREAPDVFIPELRELCSSSGVAVVFVPELPGTRICGAVRWLSPEKALIQLSLRYKRDDHLWFSFFHEAGHIILHGKKDVFIEEEKTEGIKEDEANSFASNFLIPSVMLESFMNTDKKGARDIEIFAEKVGIAPGIVVGQLQHKGYLQMNWCNNLKRHIDWDEIKNL